MGFFVCNFVICDKIYFREFVLRQNRQKGRTMKKKVMAVVVLLVLICFSFSYAAGLGPIRPLGNKKVCIGFENDYVFSRPIKAKVDVLGGKIKESNNNFLLLGLGLTKYFNIYTRLGAGNLTEQLEWSGGSDQAIQYQYGFKWAVGANGLYKFKNNLGIGFDAQFNMSSNRAKSVSGTSNPVLEVKGPVNIYETQLSPYITYDLNINKDVKVMPYIGGYYSFYRIHKGIDLSDQEGGGYWTYDEKIRGNQNLGVLGGFEVAFLKHLIFKIEGRFLAETAVSTSLIYKF